VRIGAILNDLKFGMYEEKIDIILWNEETTKFISNALSPATVDDVFIVSEDDHKAVAIVPDEQLSLAIGKEGQNVRLAAKLTGWNIDIIGESQRAEFDKQQKAAKKEAKGEIKAEKPAKKAKVVASESAEQETMGAEEVKPKAKAKKAAVKKAAVKKVAVKKAVALKTTAVKKAAAKKTAVKKTVVKKVAAKKPAVKKTAVKKTAAKKPATKKVAK
jgi:N utilization substance protein A